MRTTIASGFAAVVLLLAAIGLYGLLAGEVAARVKEIGIRLALGGSPRTVVRDVAQFASVVPAWRAARIDPNRALRTD